MGNLVNLPLFVKFSTVQQIAQPTNGCFILVQFHFDANPQDLGKVIPIDAQSNIIRDRIVVKSIDHFFMG